MYIAVKKTKTFPNTGTAAASNNEYKEAVFKNCAAFTDYISEINNTEIDKAKDIGVVMNVYNLIEYNENYSKTSTSLWLYYRDQPALDKKGKITDFPVNNDSSLSINYKKNVTGRA